MWVGFGAVCRTSGARDFFGLFSRTLRSGLTYAALRGWCGVGGWCWRRFALDAFVVRAAAEKRWQSHRTPKVLGG